MKINKIIRDQLVDIKTKFDPVKVRKLKSLKEIKSKPIHDAHNGTSHYTR